MADTRKAAVVPATAVTEPAKGSDAAAKSQETTEREQNWDGTGNRLLAVRHEQADPELVYNGLTTVPQVEAPNTDEHTGRFIAVSRLEAPEPSVETSDKPTVIAPGSVVEGLSDEQLRPLISSGAVRRETKDEAREGDK